MSTTGNIVPVCAGVHDYAVLMGAVWLSGVEVCIHHCKQISQINQTPNLQARSLLAENIEQDLKGQEHQDPERKKTQQCTRSLPEEEDMSSQLIGCNLFTRLPAKTEKEIHERELTWTSIVPLMRGFDEVILKSDPNGRSEQGKNTNKMA